jgi:hypothetical protein
MSMRTRTAPLSTQESMRRFTRRARTLVKPVICIAALTTAACSDSAGTTDARPPVPGTLTLSWVTPNQVEGAVRLTLKGPDIGTITAAQSEDMVFTRSSGTIHSIIVMGMVESGGLVRFEVPDVHQAQLYEVDIIEVSAADTDELRTSLSGYGVGVQR